MNATTALAQQALATTDAPAGVSYAFQPIVAAGSYDVVGYEALLRTQAGGSALDLLATIPEQQLNRFDRDSRVIAIRQASQLGLGQRQLNLNFRPSSMLDKQLLPIESLIQAVHDNGLLMSQVVIEITEQELIGNYQAFAVLINSYRGYGVRYAIDDFGAGYSGLNLLATFQPDQLKIDMELVRGISRSGPRQAIVRAVRSVCTDLAIDLVAEGVETLDELHWLEDAGVEYFQGYLFARPGLNALPPITLPSRAALAPAA